MGNCLKKNAKALLVLVLSGVLLASCGSTKDSSSGSSSIATSESASSSMATSSSMSSSSSEATFFAVTAPTGEHFTFKGEDKAEEGKDYSFTLTFAYGYEGSVNVNGSKVTLIDGAYTITNVKEAIVITVTDVAPITLSITAPTGTHFTFTGEASATYGEAYSFKVIFEEGYKGDVKVNGEVVTLEEDGTYTISFMKGNITITVENVAAPYAITYATGDGYVFTGPSIIAEGGSFSFALAYTEGSSGGTVTATGGDLKKNDDGTYTVSNVLSDVSISIVDLMKVYNVSDAVADFLTNDSKPTVSEDINTAGGYSHSISLAVTNGGFAAYSAPKALVDVPLSSYEKLSFSIKSTAGGWWELLDSKATTKVAGNKTSWTEISFVKEDTVYRVYTGGEWNDFTLDPSATLASLYLRLGIGETFLMSNLIGQAKADTAPASLAYSEALDNPFADLTGTASASIPAIDAATSSTSMSIGWASTGHPLASLDLSTYNEVLFYLQYVSDGSGYSGVFGSTGTSTLNSQGEELLLVNHWTPVRLIRSGDSFITSFNSISCGTQTITNLNKLRVSSNGTYLVSQVFVVAK